MYDINSKEINILADIEERRRSLLPPKTKEQWLIVGLPRYDNILCAEEKYSRAMLPPYQPESIEEAIEMCIKQREEIRNSSNDKNDEEDEISNKRLVEFDSNIPPFLQ